MNEYQLKVEFLGKVVTRLEAEKAQHERATRAAAAADSRKNSFCGDVTDGGAQSSDVTAMPGDGVVLLPHGPASTGEQVTKEIHQKLEGRRARGVRDQLFDGTDGFGEAVSDADVRRRHGRRQDDDEVDGGPSNDLDVLLKAHHAAQEKVAEDMLSLTRSLKEQTIAAGEIVRKDTKASQTRSVVVFNTIMPQHPISPVYSTTYS